MKHKFLIKTLVAVSLFVPAVNAINSFHSPIQAISRKEKLSIKYTKKFYRVVITDETQVYKVHRGYDEAHNRYTKAYKLEPGDEATIQDRGIAWGWTIGKKYNYCSMRDSNSFSWFEPYAKYHYIDSSFFLNQNKETGNIVRLTWPQYKKMWRLSFSPHKLAKWYKSAHLKIVGHAK